MYLQTVQSGNLIQFQEGGSLFGPPLVVKVINWGAMQVKDYTKETVLARIIIDKKVANAVRQVL